MPTTQTIKLKKYETALADLRADFAECRQGLDHVSVKKVRLEVRGHGYAPRVRRRWRLRFSRDCRDLTLLYCGLPDPQEDVTQRLIVGFRCSDYGLKKDGIIVGASLAVIFTGKADAIRRLRDCAARAWNAAFGLMVKAEQNWMSPLEGGWQFEAPDGLWWAAVFGLAWACKCPGFYAAQSDCDVDQAHSPYRVTDSCESTLDCAANGCVHLTDELLELAGLHGTDQKRDPAETPLYSWHRTAIGWRVVFGDERGDLRDHEGVERIVTLLKSPEQAIDVFTLTGGDSNQRVIEHSYQEQMDPATLKASRNRLAEINAGLDEANNAGNVALVEELTKEKEQILDNRKKSINVLTGNSRSLGPGTPTRKAHESVGKSLKRAYGIVRKQDPPLAKLADHLERSILDEVDAFAYRPSPPIDWHFKT